jgi:hypothetical protein
VGANGIDTMSASPTQMPVRLFHRQAPAEGEKPESLFGQAKERQNEPETTSAEREAKTPVMRIRKWQGDRFTLTKI